VRSFPKDSGVPSYDVELLAEGFENQVMEPAITTLIGEEKRMNLQSHAGQESIYLLEGKAKIILGKIHAVLHRADAVYFDSRLPHLGVSLRRKPAKTLHVHFTPRERIRQDILGDRDK